jgi:hypothetical protein
MAIGTVTYINPTWGLIPTKEQMAKYHAIHVLLKFDEDSASLPVLHNLNLPYTDPATIPRIGWNRGTVSESRGHQDDRYAAYPPEGAY